MASLWRHPKSKYWTACFTDHEGRQRKRSTKKTDRDDAMRIALDFEHAAQLARDGALTEAQCRDVLSDILRKATGEHIRQVATADFLRDWKTGKEHAQHSGTALRYAHTIKLFLAHLGDKARMVRNTDARLAHPRGLAMDKAGNLYLADTWTVRKIAHVGNNWVVTTIAGRTHVFGNADGTNSDAQFNNVAGISTDRSGNIFVTDVSNNTIRKLTPAGSNWVVTTIAGTSKTVRERNVVRALEESTDGTNGDAHFFAPFSVAADSHGNLFVLDYMTSVVRKVTQQGTNWVVMTIAGLTNHSGYADGTQQRSRFDHPRAIAIDKDDNIYVDDTGTDTIRLIKQSGTNFVVRTIIGLPWRWGYADGTNTTAQFDSASAIAVDGNGNIYLADTGNKVIRQILPPSVPQVHIILPVVGSIVVILALLIVILLLNRFFRESNGHT